MTASELSVASLLAKIVILRETGVSSTLRPTGFITGASEYWIARFRGRRRLSVGAFESVIASEAKQSMLAAQKKEWIASLRSQ
jgi:hypothetical protein